MKEAAQIILQHVIVVVLYTIMIPINIFLIVTHHTSLKESEAHGKEVIEGGYYVIFGKVPLLL